MGLLSEAFRLQLLLGFTPSCMPTTSGPQHQLQQAHAMTCVTASIAADTCMHGCRQGLAGDTLLHDEEDGVSVLWHNLQADIASASRSRAAALPAGDTASRLAVASSHGAEPMRQDLGGQQPLRAHAASPSVRQASPESHPPLPDR